MFRAEVVRRGWLTQAEELRELLDQAVVELLGWESQPAAAQCSSRFQRGVWR
jgi:hypothetical protein